MDDNSLSKIIDRCLDDRSLERYVMLAGRKATKTDTRAVAQNVIPYMVMQLDAKASRETRTAEKLHELMMQSHNPATMEDPKFASSVVTALLGSKKNEIIAANADELLVHPFVVENMICAFAPAVMRAYGAQFGKDVFRNFFRPFTSSQAPSKPMQPQPPLAPRKPEVPPKPEAIMNHPAPHRADSPKRADHISNNSNPWNRGGPGGKR